MQGFPDIPISPSSVQIIGLNRFLRRLRKDWSELAAMLRSETMAKAYAQFDKPGLGREKIATRIAAMLSPCQLARTRLKPKDGAPYLLFRTLRPTSSLYRRPQTASDHQDIVVVTWVLIGAGNCRMTTFGGLEVPDHCLKRMFDPARGGRVDADVAPIIFDGHSTLLGLRPPQLVPYADPPRGALWRAGAGAFIGLIWRSREGVPVYARAETWIANWQIRPDQAVLAPDAQPGKRLGDRLMLPLALRAMTLPR